ncbi:ribonuclease HII [Anaerobacillus sp. MEB173]|uniref:ribonuclease HII n=1 Tax=Anaerobacillus sp. MEB173 TaxID=3383345 RepID=UPI003F93E439
MGKLSIKEIEEILFDPSNVLTKQKLKELSKDDRKGVQKLVKKWQRQREEQKELEKSFEKMSIYENALRKENKKIIAGIDEVGRGPLAGPVVAAAVILPDDFYLLGLNDSKKLTSKKRDEFYEYIIEHAFAVGIGIITAKEIDEINIYEATKKAMMTAILDLPIEPEHLLIDAMKLPISLPQTSIIKGDQNSVSIAASSVIAKVTRDRIMEKLGSRFPQYGFENHMGYGTAQHLNALSEYGVMNEHRRSFSPIKELMEKEQQMKLF